MRVLMFAIIFQLVASWRIITSSHRLRLTNARLHEANGSIFIENQCIDCDACRWMCPSVFGRKLGRASVIKDPTSEQEKLQVKAAMVTCPVGAIKPIAEDMKDYQDTGKLFPSEIDPVNIPGIFHVGFHSTFSLGATPYLIKRPDGNIMVDVPRYDESLANSLENMGGLAHIFITHRHHVAEHQKWKERFPNCTRIMHKVDAIDEESSKCELLLQGQGIWRRAEDLTIIHTPGHTAGSICLLYHNAATAQGVLFSGNHLSYSFSKKSLDGFKRSNEGNVDVQAATIRMLAEDFFNFTWILPGHGRVARFVSLEDKREKILKAADEFLSEDESENCLAVGFS